MTKTPYPQSPLQLEVIDFLSPRLLSPPPLPAWAVGLKLSTIAYVAKELAR